MDLFGYSRSTFYGTLPSGEIFNWSLWCNEAPADAASTQQQATAFAAAYKAAPGVYLPPEKLLSSSSAYSGCRVYSYMEHNTKATYIADAPINVPGSSGSTSLLPDQLAVVVGLRTDMAGRRHMGRVYLPITAWGLSSQAQLSTADCTGLAGWFAQFIRALNGNIGSQRVGVLSQAGATFTPVTSVKVDSKLDTQRRRTKRASVNSVGTATV